MARREMAVPTDQDRSAQQFIYYRDEETDAKARKEHERDKLKGWLTLQAQNGKFLHGREDENGHRYLDFDRPITIGETTYTGVVAQKKLPTPYIDLDAVEGLLNELDPEGKLYDMVFERVIERRFNEDKLYVLNQRGVISDEQMDALEVQGDPSYSLTVVKE
jgi:hypothetical protein